MLQRHHLQADGGFAVRGGRLLRQLQGEGPKPTQGPPEQICCSPLLDNCGTTRCLRAENDYHSNDDLLTTTALRTLSPTDNTLTHSLCVESIEHVTLPVSSYVLHEFTLTLLPLKGYIMLV